jgi:hypothetical protein
MGFAISGWPGDGLPRYFVPPAIAFAVALVGLRKEIEALRRPIVTGALLVMVAATVMNAKKLNDRRAAGVSITSHPGLSIAGLRADFAHSAEKARVSHAIVLQEASFWIYHPGVDFISSDMGVEGARKYLQEHFPAEASRLAQE